MPASPIFFLHIIEEQQNVVPTPLWDNTLHKVVGLNLLTPLPLVSVIKVHFAEGRVDISVFTFENGNGWNHYHPNMARTRECWKYFCLFLGISCRTDLPLHPSVEWEEKLNNSLVLLFLSAWAWRNHEDLKTCLALSTAIFNVCLYHRKPAYTQNSCWRSRAAARREDKTSQASLCSNIRASSPA